MKPDKRRRFEEKSTEHLREESIYWETEVALLKQAIAAALSQRLERCDVTLSELARSLGTSRAALNRVFDPANTALTLATLARTAAALGCKVKLEIVVARGPRGRIIGRAASAGPSRAGPGLATGWLGARRG
jgi:DNA-binding Xre family transcriptional regulator